MTYGRRIALKLMDYGWYNPRAGEDNSQTPASPRESYDNDGEGRTTKPQQPSLRKAWAYFEHTALSRYIVDPNPPHADQNVLVRLFYRCIRPGEIKMERYVVIYSIYVYYLIGSGSYFSCFLSTEDKFIMSFCCFFSAYLMYLINPIFDF